MEFFLHIFYFVPGAVFIPTRQVSRKATPNGFTEIPLDLRKELTLNIHP
jgi:hypothetical protein